MKNTETGFFNEDRYNDVKIKKYALITDCSFKRSDCDKLGLYLLLDMEDHGSVYWSFHDIKDIEKFFNLLGVNNIHDIKGKVVETWWEKQESWGCKILGLTVNKKLILKGGK
jgi:hypothetical protein